MPGNRNSTDSTRNKQDEFYTQLSLIENELKHYKTHFKDKIVLCNRRRIRILHRPQWTINFFSQETSEIQLTVSPAYRVVVNDVTDIKGDGRIDLTDTEYLIRNKKIP